MNANLTAEQATENRVGMEYRKGVAWLRITHEDQFGGTPHVGVHFTFDGERYDAGWVPVAMLATVIAPFVG